MVGEDVDGIGIAYQWTLCAPQLGDDGDGGLLAGAKAGAYADGVEVIGIDGLGEGGLLTVELQHGLGHADLQDDLIALRGVGGHTASSHAQTCLRGEDGSPAHAVAAGDDEGIAHLPLMGEGIAGQEPLADIVLLEQRVLGVGLLDAFLAQADVEHAKAADELLVLGE